MVAKVLELQQLRPSNEYSELISLRIDWFDLLAVQRTLKSLIQHHCLKHQFFSAQPSLWTNSHHPYMTTGKTIGNPYYALTVQFVMPTNIKLH